MGVGFREKALCWCKWSDPKMGSIGDFLMQIPMDEHGEAPLGSLAN